MANKYSDLIERFESHFRALEAKCRTLQKENKDLQQELAHCQNEVIRTHQLLATLQKQNDHLQIANAIATTNEEKQVARDRLTRMVREIDKCLALLTE